MPRKGVLELQRLLGNEGDVELAIGSNHIRAQIGDIRFTSKLIDGRFPEYGRVIPASPAEEDLLPIATSCERRFSVRRSCRTRSTAAFGSR